MPAASSGEGLAVRRARWKRELYSAEALVERKRVREPLGTFKADGLGLIRVASMHGVIPRNLTFAI